MRREVVEDVAPFDRAAPRRWCDGAGEDAIADLAEPGVARECLGAFARHFQAVVFGGIVGCRDHHAAVEAVLADGEVERVGRDEADVGDVGAGFVRPARERLEQGDARRAHVAADDDAAQPELLDERPADGVGRIVAQLVRVDAADVVALEDAGLERGRHRRRRFAGPSGEP